MKKPDATIVGDLNMVLLEDGQSIDENVSSQHHHIPFALLIECDNAEQVKQAISTGRCEFTVLGGDLYEPPAPDLKESITLAELNYKLLAYDKQNNLGHVWIRPLIEHLYNATPAPDGMSAAEYDNTGWTGQMKAEYRGKVYAIGSCYFPERLVGLVGVCEGTDESDDYTWVRCENIKLLT